VELDIRTVSDPESNTFLFKVSLGSIKLNPTSLGLFSHPDIRNIIEAKKTDDSKKDK
jgi:hypothetical protein